MHKNLLKVLLVGTAIIGVGSVAAAGNGVPSVSIEIERLPSLSNYDAIDWSSPVFDTTGAGASTVSSVSTITPLLNSDGSLANPIYIPGSGGTSVYNAVPTSVSAPASSTVTGLPVTPDTPLSEVKITGPSTATYAPTPDQSALQLAPSATQTPTVTPTSTPTPTTTPTPTPAPQVTPTPASGPTVVATGTDETGGLVQKMSDGTFRVNGKAVTPNSADWGSVGEAGLTPTPAMYNTQTGEPIFASAEGKWVDANGKVLGDIKVGDNTFQFGEQTRVFNVASEGVVTALKNGVSLGVANAAQVAANAAATAAVNSAVSQALSSTFTQAASQLAEKGVELTASNLAAEASKILGDKAGSVVTEAAKGATEAATKAASDAAAKTLGSGAGDAAKQMANTAASDAVEAAGQNVQQSIQSAAAEWLVEAIIPYKVMQFNYLQYALLIWEAIKGNEIDDATKEVKVKGAEPMQDSQGAQGSGASTATTGTAISATTISGSANALITLLNMAKIDLSLLSTEIKKPEQQEVKGAVVASAGTSGADVGASGQTTSTTDEGTLTSDEQREIMHRRALLLGEWATAATQIGEGSNAISRVFYDRAAAFAAAANAAQGSLGGITAIADTDRFVLFEITRGAALSAMQLGLQGATNLNDIEEVETTSTSSSNTAAKASVSVSGAKPQ